MNEKKLKVITTLGKVSGFLTMVSAKSDLIPEKYAWVGVVIILASSVLKDTVMLLGDLWDDGKLNKSFGGDVSKLTVTNETAVK